MVTVWHKERGPSSPLVILVKLPNTESYAALEPVKAPVVQVVSAPLGQEAGEPRALGISSGNCMVTLKCEEAPEQSEFEANIQWVNVPVSKGKEVHRI